MAASSSARPANAAKQLRQQPRTADRFGEDVVHLAQPDDRHGAIGLADRAFDRL